ncbi:uncharacterized protein LOC116417975 [Nasonia vitripennis]|uniref:OTU domain-containing protein n=1 Tax=Nasonia vitripennis TaxID=7425 RepID=A0A7M7QKC7_NASVI|nr:uncharacterized protein LOC116417975 [Nasonia vitripennis]
MIERCFVDHERVDDDDEEENVQPAKSLPVGGYVLTPANTTDISYAGILQPLEPGFQFDRNIRVDEGTIMKIKSNPNNSLSSMVKVSVKNSNKEYDRLLKIIQVERDGNCLFRSFSLFIHGNEKYHMKIREKIVKFVFNNWKSEKDMIFATCVEKVYKNANNYKNTMGCQGEFGTDYEIGVFSRLYNVTVNIFISVSFDVVRKILTLNTSGIQNNKKQNVKCLNILHSGHSRVGHWQILTEV